MKTLKTLTLGFCLLFVCFIAKANTTLIEDKLANQYYAINTYIDAVSRGKLAGIDQVVDNSATFNILRGKEIMSFDKAQMLKFMKQHENVEQVCTVSTAVVSSNADMAVVRVNMKYEGFVCSNYVTISNAGNRWKITNVYSVFK